MLIAHVCAMCSTLRIANFTITPINLKNKFSFMDSFIVQVVHWLEGWDSFSAMSKNLAFLRVYIGSCRPLSLVSKYCLTFKRKGRETDQTTPSVTVNRTDASLVTTHKETFDIQTVFQKYK